MGSKGFLGQEKCKNNFLHLDLWAGPIFKVYYGFPTTKKNVPKCPTFHLHKMHHISAFFSCAAGEHVEIPSEKTLQSFALSYFILPGQEHNKKQMAQNCSKLISKNEGSSKLFQMVFKKFTAVFGPQLLHPTGSGTQQKKDGSKLFQIDFRK